MAHRTCVPGRGPGHTWNQFKISWLCTYCKPCNGPTNSFSLLDNLPLVNPQSPNRLELESESNRDCPSVLTFGQSPLSVEDHTIQEFKSTKGLRICHLNVHSLRNKIEEIKILLSDCSIHILALSETWLNEDRDLNCEYEIDGYTMSRFDRLHREGGGSIIYVNDCIDYQPYGVPKMYLDSECQAVKLCLKQSSPIIVCSVYSHPSTSKPMLIEYFRNLNVLLNATNLEYIILGDFNLNLLERNGDTFEIKNVCKEFSLQQVIAGHTHNGGSLLDHVYVSRINNISFTNHCPFAGSDHDLVMTVRKINRMKFPPQIIQYRKISNLECEEASADFEKFEFSSDCDVDGEFLESEYQRYNTYCMSIVNKYAPLKKRIVKGRLCQWYTSRLSHLRKNRDNCHVMYRQNRDDEHKKEFTKARNKYNIEMYWAKKNYFRREFEQTKSNSKNLWDRVNELNGYRKKVSRLPNLNDPSNSDINTVISIDKTCDLLADEFIVKNEDTIISDIVIADKIEAYCKEHKSSNSLEYLQPAAIVSETGVSEVADVNEVTDVSIEEVKRAVLGTKRDSSSPSLMSVFAIRKQLSSLAPYLSLLFSLILITGVVPSVFKIK